MILAFDVSTDCNAERLIQSSKKMKRTITEIIVEVEETMALRLKKQNSPASEIENRETTDEPAACPFCGQALLEIKKLNSKNEE